MIFSPIRLLALLSLLLLGGLAWLWFDQSGDARSIAWMPPSPISPELTKPVAVASATGLSANPAEHLLILERPIFAPDRRPPPPPAPPVALPPPDPLENIQLSGIVSGANPGIIARVDGKARRLKINESIGAWTLQSISGRDVTFAQGTDTRQVRLTYSRLGPPVMQTAASSAPSQNPPGQSTGGTLIQNAQDEGRERLRRANALRAANGMPVLSE